MLPTQEPKIIFPRPADNAKVDLVKDIVFIRRYSNSNLFAFALGYIKRATDLTFEELFIPDDDNLEEGVGVYRISGEISVLANSYHAQQAVNKIVGQRFEAQVLYSSGQVLPIPYRNASGAPLDYSKPPVRHLFDRYPEIAKFRDKFGVKLRVVESFGGSNDSLRLSITGITMERQKHWPASIAEFYASIPNLNRGLTLHPTKEAGISSIASAASLSTSNAS